MHGTDDDARSLMLRITASGLSPNAHRDLFAYWGRRKVEARPQDWT